MATETASDVAERQPRPSVGPAASAVAYGAQSLQQLGSRDPDRVQQLRRSDRGFGAEHPSDVRQCLGHARFGMLAQAAGAGTAADAERQVRVHRVALRDAELVIRRGRAPLRLERVRDPGHVQAAFAPAQRLAVPVAHEDHGARLGDRAPRHPARLGIRACPTAQCPSGDFARSWRLVRRETMTSREVAGGRIELVQGDITRQATDAIVNAANTTLLGGGGVDGAIHRAGGPAILEECRRIGGCPTGEARLTTAGNLPARFVIHTVGPVYRDGRHGEPELLGSAYRRSLEVAAEQQLRSLAFPSISTGAYRFPVQDAAGIALGTVSSFLEERPGILDLVRFVLFSASDLRVYGDALDRL